MSDEDRIDTKVFTLTMLGTDTLYFPWLKMEHQGSPPQITSDYPKGETLSVISSLIQTKCPPLFNASLPSPYQADEIAVVNGPETTGSDVNDRIGHGLAATLKAIARGQVTINIIAHSRGVVESTLIAHELNDIQDMISSCNNLEELLANIKQKQEARTGNTKDILLAMRGQLPTENKEAWFSDLKNNIAKASIHFLGIDPVPGDIFPITWNDQRFYSLAGIIKTAEILYYENERTRGFTPIFIETTNPSQQLIRQTIPGHHGSGSSGNNLTQQKAAIDPSLGKTTHVQKLLLYKILGFLVQHGVAFKSNPEIFQKKKSLGRKYIKMLTDNITRNHSESDAPLNISNIDFPATLLDLYKKIEENKQAYETFNKSHYPILGMAAPYRKMLVQGNKYVTFNSVLTPTSSYVNKEHAQLMQDHFFKLFQLDNTEKLSLAELIDAAHEQLEKNIQEMSETVAQMDSSFTLIPEQVQPPLLNSEAKIQDVLTNFSALISHISQKYLEDEWNTPEKRQEKKKLFSAISRILGKLNQLSTTSHQRASQFVKQLVGVGLSGLIHTIDQLHHTLEQDFNRLHATQDEKLSHFFYVVVAQLSDAEINDEIRSTIDQIIKSEAFSTLASYPIHSKIAHITKELPIHLPETDKLPARFNSEFEDSLDDFEQEYSLDDFEQEYRKLQLVIKDIASLSQLVPEKKYLFAPYELSLKQKAEQLLDDAAQRFYKDRPLALPEPAEKGTLRALIEHKAINQYGVINRLAERNVQLTRENEQLLQDKQKLHQCLNDENEARCLLIQKRLIQHTQEYLDSLNTSVENDECKEKKIQALGKLLDCLQNTQNNPIPSARIRLFNQELKTAEHDLKKHRDKDWKRYVKYCAILLGILGSGIIPGLIAYTLYLNTGKKSEKSIRFWQSRGENIINELNDREHPEDENNASEPSV